MQPFLPPPPPPPRQQSANITNKNFQYVNGRRVGGQRPPNNQNRRPGNYSSPRPNFESNHYVGGYMTQPASSAYIGAQAIPSNHLNVSYPNSHNGKSLNNVSLPNSSYIQHRPPHYNADQIYQRPHRPPISSQHYLETEQLKKRQRVNYEAISTNKEISKPAKSLEAEEPLTDFFALPASPTSSNHSMSSNISQSDTPGLQNTKPSLNVIPGTDITLSTPAEIEAWREERRRKWPTNANILKKKLFEEKERKEKLQRKEQEQKEREAQKENEKQKLAAAGVEDETNNFKQPVPPKFKNSKKASNIKNERGDRGKKNTASTIRGKNVKFRERKTLMSRLMDRQEEEENKKLYQAIKYLVDKNSLVNIQR